MSEDAGEEWLTVPEAARRLGIGERKAYRQTAKLSDSDVKVSDTGQRLVRQSAMGCLTEGRTRRAEATSSPLPQSVLEAAPVSQLSDAAPLVSDTTLRLSDTGGRLSDTTARQPDAEVQLLRKDLARVEDENRFMREQLALAMSGWREEQRRSREYEKRMKELTGPAEGETLEAPPKAPGGTETGAMTQGGAEAIGAAESPAEEKPAAGWWTRLWGGKG